MTRIRTSALSSIIPRALSLFVAAGACGRKNGEARDPDDHETAPGPSASAAAPRCPVSASGEPLPIDTARIDPTRTNQPLLDKARDAAPTLMLENVIVSLKVAEEDGGPMTSDADRQRRLEGRQRSAKAALDAARPDLVALGVVISSESSIRPTFYVKLPACLLPTLFSDSRIARVDLGTEVTRDGTVKLDQ